ncbi:hypothetical protein V8D89_011095 [Ganoderma adspersum]
MPLNHRGYGAYISHNGEEVEVHKPELERDKVTMSGYIVSEAGMEFKVHWVESGWDGRRMGVVSHVKGSSKTSSCGFRVAVDALAPYQFAPLVTHDDDLLPSAYSEDLGTIEIKLRRVRDFVSVAFTPRTPHPGGSVHERKTRGRGTGSHCVSLGGKKDVKLKSTILKPILIDDKPYVVFRFYYRPRNFLESKGITQGRSPSRSSSATVVGSAKSLSGRRKKRQRLPSEAPPSPRADSPPPPKRRRSIFEQEDDTSIPTAEADQTIPTPMPDEDEDDNKENVVEIRLSSRDNYAIPGESASCVRVKTESSVSAERDSPPRIKRESSSEPPRRPSKRVKREPSLSPAREASRPIKREPSPLPSLLPPPSARRVPSPGPIVKTEQSSPQRLRIPAVKREPLSPPLRTSPSRLKKNPAPSVLKGRLPDVKAEPSDNDTLAPPPPTPEGDVQQELPAPKEEEGIWDEEEETLVEVAEMRGRST